MFAFVYYSPIRDLKHLKIILYLLPAILISACAKVGTISGGETDTIPPVLLTSIPLNYSTNFTGKKVKVSFNEFIDLKDITKEFMVSPPLSKLPEVRNINKDLIITPLDSLRPNTTYTLSFGNSVVDFTAGNPVQNFEFVFSTGNSVDSLSVHGRLLNAFDLNPLKEPVYVMLYNNLNDSAPYNTLPSYICRTDKFGRFRLNNLKASDYRLFALKDANNNMKFDLLSESIAFADSIIHLSPLPMKDIVELFPDTTRKNVSIKKPRSIKGKTIKAKPVVHKDTLKLDSLKILPHKKYGQIQSLFLFQELSTKQFLRDYKRITKETLRFVMNLPLRKQDTISITLLDSILYKDLFIQENYTIGDTIDFWIKDSTLIHREIIKIAAKIPFSDSIGNIYLKRDTFDFKFAFKEVKKKKKEKPVLPKLNLKCNAVPGAAFDLNNFIQIEAANPVQSFNTSFIQLFVMVDTIPKAVKYVLRKDSLNTRKFLIINKWEEGSDYRLKIFPGAFKDIYGLNPDTTLIKFKAQKADYYGKFIITLDSVTGPMIVQILQKDKLIAQKFISHSGQLTYDYIIPGKYKIKYIFDKNGNKKWDTGIYLKKLEPEKVKFWWKEEDVRSGFDVEIQISCKD